MRLLAMPCIAPTRHVGAAGRIPEVSASRIPGSASRIPGSASRIPGSRERYPWERGPYPWESRAVSLGARAGSLGVAGRIPGSVWRTSRLDCKSDGAPRIPQARSACASTQRGFRQ